MDVDVKINFFFLQKSVSVLRILNNVSKISLKNSINFKMQKSLSLFVSQKSEIVFLNFTFNQNIIFGQ